jgi:hypothetical protein
MTSEFDIVFDKICDDVFPKLFIYINEEVRKGNVKNGRVDTHLVMEFLTDIEGYNTDMAFKIWESYTYNKKRIAPQ